MTTVSDTRLVTLPMSEIQRIRDVLMRARDDSPRVRELFRQVASLYQRLEKGLTEKEAHERGPHEVRSS